MVAREATNAGGTPSPSSITPSLPSRSAWAIALGTSARASTTMSSLLLWDSAKPAFISSSFASFMGSSSAMAKARAVCLLGR